MQCPRCHTEIDAAPNPGSPIVCPGCGVRLMTRAGATRTGGGGSSPSAPSPSNPALEAHPPSATLPPTPLHKKVPRPAESETPAAGTAALRQAGNGSVTLEELMAEVRLVRETQQQILTLLQGGVRAKTIGAEAFGDDDAAPGFLAPVRSHKRKSVLLIDDDPATREATMAEMGGAQVPVRAVADGNAALEAIAADKPDVIALELGIAGEMDGKDVINMIKATMEWVDIPIILYTRVPLESQKEARTVHGADDLVLKRSGPAALVSRVITAFRGRA
jgi:CheY-like chemotaxis protein